MAVPITSKEKSVLIKAGIILALAYGAVWGSERLRNDYTQSIASENRELREELASFTSRLSDIDQEERLQSDYVEDYNSFLRRNLIAGPAFLENEELVAQFDEERRLYVLERLQQIKNQRKFFDIKYDLTKPDNLPSSFSELTAGSDVAVRANRMNIEMPLLHSLDLLMLLSDFYDEEDNRFTPVYCSMSFIGEPVEEAKDESLLLNARENINSRCDLMWLSVYDPKLNQNQELQADAQS